MKFDIQKFAEGEGAGEVQVDGKTIDTGDKTSADDVKQDNPADDVQAKIDAAWRKFLLLFIQKLAVNPLEVFFS